MLSRLVTLDAGPNEKIKKGLSVMLPGVWKLRMAYNFSDT